MVLSRFLYSKEKRKSTPYCHLICCGFVRQLGQVITALAPVRIEYVHVEYLAATGFGTN